jgi:hypothetical protein
VPEFGDLGLLLDPPDEPTLRALPGAVTSELVILEDGDHVNRSITCLSGLEGPHEVDGPVALAHAGSPEVELRGDIDPRSIAVRELGVVGQGDKQDLGLGYHIVDRVEELPIRELEQGPEAVLEASAIGLVATLSGRADNLKHDVAIRIDERQVQE